MRRPPRFGSTRRFPEPNGVRLGHRGGGGDRSAGSAAPSNSPSSPDSRWRPGRWRPPARSPTGWSWWSRHRTVRAGPEDPGGDRPAVDAQPASTGADRVVTGGATRAASVRAGLAAVPDDAAIIVVHDAARPLATDELFASVVAVRPLHRGRRGHPGGAGLRHPEAGGWRQGGPQRRSRWTGRGPDTAGVRGRHAAAGPPACGEATDDAGLLEELGATVRTVEGDPHNVKLTRPEDLALAEALLRMAGR